MKNIKKEFIEQFYNKLKENSEEGIVSAIGSIPLESIMEEFDIKNANSLIYLLNKKAKDFNIPVRFTKKTKNKETFNLLNKSEFTEWLNNLDSKTWLIFSLRH